MAGLIALSADISSEASQAARNKARFTNILVIIVIPVIADAFPTFEMAVHALLAVQTFKGIVTFITVNQSYIAVLTFLFLLIDVLTSIVAHAGSFLHMESIVALVTCISALTILASDRTFLASVLMQEETFVTHTVLSIINEMFVFITDTEPIFESIMRRLIARVTIFFICA